MIIEEDLDLINQNLKREDLLVGSFYLLLIIGFTGTIMGCPETELIYIFLSNRIHPDVKI